MHPDTILNDPPRRRVLSGLPLVVRKRGAVVLEGLANAVLQCGIDQQTPRHHHQQGHDPLGLLEVKRGGHQAGVLEEATATCPLRLTCIAREQLLDGQAGRVECMGGEQATTRPVDTWLRGRDGAGKRPCNGVEELGR
jgi:hypothetical protein